VTHPIRALVTGGTFDKEYDEAQEPAERHLRGGELITAPGAPASECT
jgi:hypothetical protein